MNGGDEAMGGRDEAGDDDGFNTELGEDEFTSKAASMLLEFLDWYVFLLCLTFFYILPHLSLTH